MRSLSQLAAAVNPAGKTLTKSAVRRESGPSWRHRPEKLRWGIGSIFPIHGPPIRPVTRYAFWSRLRCEIKSSAWQSACSQLPVASVCAMMCKFYIQINIPDQPPANLPDDSAAKEPHSACALLQFPSSGMTKSDEKSKWRGSLVTMLISFCIPMICVPDAFYALETIGR